MSTKQVVKKVVVCGDLGPDYTPPGTYEDIIQDKARATKAIWETLKNNVKNNKRDEPILKPYDFISEVAWQEVVDNLISPTDTNKKRVKMLMDLESNGVDLWDSDEATNRNALIAIVQHENRHVERSTYMSNLITYMRQGYKTLGRQNEYGQGKLIHIGGGQKLNTGNPASKATQDFMMDLIKKKEKAKKESGEEIDMREGAPASLALVFFTEMYLIRKGIQSIQSINQQVRITNSLQLSLLLTMLMHEISRPGDCFRHMMHAHLHLPLHKRVYMLSFAFLRPQSFAYFLEHDLLHKYVQAFWKGKGLQLFLERMKSTIPLCQNSLDMFVRYVVIMRVCMMVDSSILTPLVFRPASWIGLLVALSKEVGFSMYTFYSLRYAHAEEMNKGKVLDEFIRALMGHVMDSNMNKHYAANKDKRVTVLGEPIQLGVDIMGCATDELIIPLEFNSVNGGVFHNSSFLDNIEDADVRAEFEEVCNLTTAWIENKDDTAKSNLLERVKVPITDPAKHRVRWAKHKSVLAYLSHIPLGFHFTFPTKAMPASLRAEMYEGENSIMAFMEKTFKNVELPEGAKIPEIWSLVQMVLGNFRNPVPHTDQAKSIVAKDLPLPVCPTRTVTPKIKKMLVKEVATDNAPAKRKHPEPEHIEEWDYIPDEIETCDYVVLLASQKDQFAFELPNIKDRYIWIIKSAKYTPRTRTLKGIFMYNRSRNPQDPWHCDVKPQPAMSIEDYDIMAILHPYIPYKKDGSPYGEDEVIDKDEVSEWKYEAITTLTDDNIQHIESNVVKVIQLAERVAKTKKKKRSG